MAVDAHDIRLLNMNLRKQAQYYDFKLTKSAMMEGINVVLFDKNIQCDRGRDRAAARPAL